jgi:hypothetical protein
VVSLVVGKLVEGKMVFDFKKQLSVKAEESLLIG